MTIIIITIAAAASVSCMVVVGRVVDDDGDTGS